MYDTHGSDLYLIRTRDDVYIYYITPLRTLHIR